MRLFSEMLKEKRKTNVCVTGILRFLRNSQHSRVFLRFLRIEKVLFPRDFYTFGQKHEKLLGSGKVTENTTFPTPDPYTPMKRQVIQHFLTETHVRIMTGTDKFRPAGRPLR